jgi:putative effector of murein hydrolase LrgA (UPF0299 family)
MPVMTIVGNFIQICLYIKITKNTYNLLLLLYIYIKIVKINKNYNKNIQIW